MYEWLEDEIAAIKTHRFHLVDGPAEPKFREAVLRSRLCLPRSYQEFVLKFGNAKLYRCSRSDYYAITVFAGPREERREDGTLIYQIGSDDDARVLVIPGAEPGAFPVYKRELESTEKVADDFEEWLTESCARVRNSYGIEKWEEILRGPEPFSSEEEEVIEARRRIRWRVLGIDAAGNQIIEITNSDSRTLPVLTVGVRSRDRRLNGAVQLKIGHIGPGNSDVLYVPCYKEFVPPEEQELFALPDPRPEDRDYYGELGEA